MELKTPLYDAHVKAGGKIVPFAGYLLPVQYETGVIKEHMAVRTQAEVAKVTESLGDDGRILLRQSGTEPVVRVMVEAPSLETCEKYVDQVIQVMKTQGHVL